MALDRRKAALKITNVKLSAICKDRAIHYMQEHEDAANGAPKTNNTAAVWRHERALTSPLLGPKNRFFQRLPAANPSFTEWREYMAKPGWQGGCVAFEVYVDEVRSVGDSPNITPWRRAFCGC